MNPRERYNATMAFEDLDRPLYWDCAFWPETLERWYSEGLPRSVEDEKATRRRTVPLDIERHAGLDENYLHLPVETRHLYPAFEEEVLEDHGSWVLRRNRDGGIEKALAGGKTGMRSVVSGIVQTRQDWQRISEERIRPSLEGRVPQDFEDWIRDCQEATGPVRGLILEHWLNLGELLGLDRLLCLMVEDPAWLKEMFEYLSEFFISLCTQVLDRFTPDVCFVGGDFCYKGGCLFSPQAFREFLLPEFKKITSVYRDYGIRTVLMHTDGDCRALIPMFIEAGVTGLHPFEVTNGQDIVDVREAFPRFQILGGIDKRAVAAGRESIDAELGGKLPFMLKRGGYIPYIDHSIPPDVSLENYLYYRRRIEELSVGG